MERYRALQRETPDYMEPLGLSCSLGQTIEAAFFSLLRKRLHGMDDVIGLRDPAEDLCCLRKPFSPNSRRS